MPQGQDTLTQGQEILIQSVDTIIVKGQDI